MLINLDAPPTSNFQSITWFQLLIQIHILNDKQRRSRFRSQLIWIYTVCQNRAYPGSAGLGLSIAQRKQTLTVTILRRRDLIAFLTCLIWLFSLSTTFADDMVSLSDMICHCIFVKQISEDFCSDLMYIFGIFLMFAVSHVEFSACFTYVFELIFLAQDLVHYTTSIFLFYFVFEMDKAFLSM